MAYTGTGSEGDFCINNNPIRREMREDEQKPEEYALKRVNATIDVRGKQMDTNILGLEGGREYVNKRLSRFAGETMIDWEGGERIDGTMVTGRKQQTHCFPYLRRIADKINQHVFSELPKREGVDEGFEEDATADGKSINKVMMQANDYVTACGWCWIGIDVPMVTEQVSVAERDESKIRPYWQVYSPTAVKDWKFDGIGNLEWLITETEEIESTTAEEEPSIYRTRAIWKREDSNVRIVRMQLSDNKWKPVSDETINISYKGVPFVLVGSISSGGHVFDDLESINRTMMDLESVNRANFFKRCYPQLVLPQSCIQNTADTMSVSPHRASELIVGMNYPLMIGENDPAPMYLMPSASDMGALRSEIQELKRNMFDSVGLMLQNESRQVASAEAKMWDFLDISHVMAARATLLEEAETKAALITNEWDSTIPLWEPVYNRQFDIGDFQAEVTSLIQASNASMPPEMYRAVLSKLFDRIDRVGAHFTDEQRQEVEEAINNFEVSGIDAFSLATP